MLFRSVVDWINANIPGGMGSQFGKLCYYVVVSEYGGPPEQQSALNLVYILAYPSKEAREKAWKDFMADPDWQKAKAESEVNGKLVDKVESVFLKPTDYSPIK